MPARQHNGGQAEPAGPGCRPPQSGTPIKRSSSRYCITQQADGQRIKIRWIVAPYHIEIMVNKKSLATRTIWPDYGTVLLHAGKMTSPRPHPQLSPPRHGLYSAPAKLILRHSGKQHDFLSPRLPLLPAAARQRSEEPQTQLRRQMYSLSSSIVSSVFRGRATRCGCSITWQESRRCIKTWP